VHQIVYLAIFWVEEITYSQDAPMTFDAKYVKRCGSGQGCAFSGSQNQNLTLTFNLTFGFGKSNTALVTRGVPAWNR